MPVQPTVFVVDPDRSTYEMFRLLAGTMNFRCEGYVSGEDFLACDSFPRPGCAVIELSVPDINGLRLQEELKQRGDGLPVVFLASQASVSIAVWAMRAGAVHFLEKPVREHELWDAVYDAIQLDIRRHDASRQREECNRRLDKLTPKEHDVLDLIARGCSKRAIADQMDVCVRTVELRRRDLMKKLGLKSLWELVHFALTTANGHSSSSIQPPVRKKMLIDD